MLDLTTPFLLKLAAVAVDDMFMLATLEGPGVPTQHFALGTRTLVWGATTAFTSGGLTLPGDRETYLATDGSFGTQRETLDSEPPQNTVTFTNLDGEWHDKIHTQALNYNGVTITFKLVFASVDPTDILDSQRARIEDGPYLLSGGNLVDEGVQFAFGAAFNALKLKVPSLLSRARRCQSEYKGPSCLSTSGLPTCDRSPGQCAVRHNGVLRFSAWPFSNRRSF